MASTRCSVYDYIQLESDVTVMLKGKSQRPSPSSHNPTTPSITHRNTMLRTPTPESLLQLQASPNPHIPAPQTTPNDREQVHASLLYTRPARSSHPKSSPYIIASKATMIPLSPASSPRYPSRPTPRALKSPVQHVPAPRELRA